MKQVKKQQEEQENDLLKNESMLSKSMCEKRSKFTFFDQNIKILHNHSRSFGDLNDINEINFVEIPDRDSSDGVTSKNKKEKLQDILNNLTPEDINDLDEDVKLKLQELLAALANNQKSNTSQKAC